MNNLSATQKLVFESVRLTALELALLADLATWAGDDERCIAIIARIYELFDDHSSGVKPRSETQDFASQVQTWMSGRDLIPNPL